MKPKLHILALLALASLTACGSHPQTPRAALYEEEVAKLSEAYENGEITDKELTERFADISVRRRSSIRSLALLNKMEEDELRLAKELNVDMEHLELYKLKAQHHAEKEKDYSLMGLIWSGIFEGIIGVDKVAHRNRYRTGFPKDRR